LKVTSCNDLINKISASMSKADIWAAIAVNGMTTRE